MNAKHDAASWGTCGEVKRGQRELWNADSRHVSDRGDIGFGDTDTGEVKREVDLNKTGGRGVWGVPRVTSLLDVFIK